MQALKANQLPLPIPPAFPADKARLSQLAEACAAAAQRGDDDTLAVREAEIDEIVYRLFDLTPDEIALIESALSPTRQSKPARARKAVVTGQGSPVMSEETERMRIGEGGSGNSPRTANPTAPWLPGELFNVEGELPPAKKAKAASEAASRKPLPAHDKDELMALLREGACERPTLIQHCTRALGYQRTSGALRQELENAIRTAIRRGFLYAEAGQIHLDCRPLDQWDRDFLKVQFLAAIHQHGRIWLDRAETVRLFSRWVGYRRTAPTIAAVAKSLTTGFLREGRLEKSPDGYIRRS